MYINSLRLNNYRNIKSAFIEFSDGINIIYGLNAQGKTNILEAVFLCSTGRSHRTRAEKELVCFGKRFSNVKILYKKNSFNDNIEVSLKSDEKKGIAVNGNPIKRIGELFGELQTVIFSPEDLCIINESPSERRRFMDMQICQINKLYYYHLHAYYKTLKQRNSLLKQKGRQSQKDNISVWDEQLTGHGIEIIKLRRWFIEALSPLAGSIHGMLTGERETLRVEYKPSVETNAFKERLNKNLERDIIYGSTSVGPHKDDIMFSINGHDAKVYGSQGQKRTVVLSCRLAEVELVKEEIGDSPVLLLDDVFSELDFSRQEMLIKYINNIQTIITATGMEDLVVNIKDGAKLFHVENGNIKEDINGQR